MFLFAYGPLKRDFPLHHLLGEPHYCHEGWVDGWKMLDLGIHPTIQPGAGLVWGEVYEITEDVLAAIERHPLYASTFKRTTMVAKMGPHEYKAVTYIMNRTLDLGVYKMISSGKWEDTAAMTTLEYDPDFDDDFDDDFDFDFEDDFDYDDDFDFDFEDDFDYDDDDDFDDDFDNDFDNDFDFEDDYDDKGITDSFPATTE